jgi:hypothetical protein
MVCSMRKPSNKGHNSDNKRLLVLKRKLKGKLYGGKDGKDNS